MLARSTLRLWLPPLGWTAVILTASSTPFSSGNTGDRMAKLIITIFGHAIDPLLFDLVHITIRKGAHLAEYGILGLLLLRAIRAERTYWNFRWCLAAIAVAAAVAGLDEWHQAFVPGRIASVYDVAIDTLGATLAQVLFFRT